MNEKYPKKVLKPPKIDVLFSKNNQSWDYFGDTGPDYWHTLDPSFSIAKTGKEQSPINILTYRVRKLKYNNIPQYHYLYSRFKICNHKYFTRLAITNPYNYIKLDNDIFYLDFIDIRTPSEHLIDGQNYPLEIQLIHENKDGEIVIISIFGQEGAENKLFEETIKRVHELKDKKKVLLNEKINMEDSLNKSSGIFRYRGSLTCPPTKENIRWVIYETPIHFSKEQIDNYRKVFHYSSRPIQSINYRYVFYYRPSLFKIIL